MYDIIFYHQTDWPETALEQTKQQFPLAKRVVVEPSDVNFIDIFQKHSKTVRTKMCWIIPTIQTLDFNFLKIVPSFVNRVFYLQDQLHNKIFLVPSKRPLTLDDFETPTPLVSTRYLKSPICYDVFFISYGETYAEDNWNKLKERVPYANRIDMVDGIFNAHKQAAAASATSFMWVVDADAVILDSFKFTYEVSLDHFDAVHIWKSRNPLNGLEYGYGGIKLLPKHLFFNRDASVDVTTSLSHNIRIIDEVSNTTEFASSPFEAWKGAFRECVKLASKIIDRQNNAETEERLSVWCSKTTDKNALKGALAGKQYGQENASNKEALSKINDFTWLQDRWSLEISQQ